MPGANCANLLYKTFLKHKVAKFKIPTKDDEYSAGWRKKY